MSEYELECDDESRIIITIDDVVQAIHDEYIEGLDEYDKDFLYTVKGLVICALDNIKNGKRHTLSKENTPKP